MAKENGQKSPKNNDQTESSKKLRDDLKCVEFTYIPNFKFLS